jgi:ApbE superfamily uncharacterized protein (UPF0280 family)
MEQDRRVYRGVSRRRGLVSFQVRHFETDLHVQAETVMDDLVSSWIIEARTAIEAHADLHPGFFEAETPLREPAVAHEVLLDMMAAARKAGTGPMAAVAGAIAEYVGKRCVAQGSREVIVENGGDIFLHVTSPVTVALWAGKSRLSGRAGITISPVATDFGVCTSSGTVGHSKSYGTADAVTVVAGSTALADAVATMTGNMIHSRADIEKGIDFARAVQGVTGVVVIKGEHLGAWGDIELAAL